ncbi:MAG: PspA/IM30 family protein [Lachnospiraceae bacterium]|nr:PspA/IM30 family protein [Lachnospiraceae bacterium]
MGIIDRFKEIMAANFNALLDKAEDPEKMIDQYMRNLEEDLAKVKSETASVMADEKNAQRKVEACKADIDKMAEYARRAVTAGNDEEAKQFLKKKADLTDQLAVLEKDYQLACDCSAKMRQMHDKLESDISSLKTRRDTLKAKIKVAETQQKLNQIGSGLASAGNNMAAFDRMEERVNHMLDEADAMAQLNSTEDTSNVEELTKKYDADSKSAAVDDELAALKAEMGLL